ncbi:hypothetical protein [Nocardia stercoris]|uniref:hypothetical protein n=1 Tax=Nocardia stercoris TaxID=2483361 RepID=UPI0011C49FD0|nr:hypothetical protein [Nocardia stercoris]
MLALVAAGLGITPATGAAAPADDTARYLGTWNYDLPAGATGTADLSIGPIMLHFPQIGTVTFSPGADGVILGHTDQGCTWRFRNVGDALELASTDQYCFNSYIGSGYNIDRWRVQVDRDTERETLHANSYQLGVTLPFQLTDARRTRAAAATRAETLQNFSGSWQFDPAASGFTNREQVNVATLAPGVGLPVPIPASSTVDYRPGEGDSIVARTDDGCEWVLEAHGSTAELAGGAQTCATPTGPLTRSLWAIASDGLRQVTIMAGTRQDGDAFLLTDGALVPR